jgi:hypothetical protein
VQAVIFFIIATSGVNSLLLPASPVGLTTPFSTSTDAEALFYNPANFDAGEQYGIWCSYNRFYLSMQSVSLALSKRIGPVALGIALLNFDYGDIELRPDYPHDDSVPYYSAHDFSLLIGSSVALSKQGRIGLNIKYITESIYVYSGHGIALDISFSYSNDRSGLSFGASNVGTKVTIRNENVNLPTAISLGGFYDLKKIRISADAHYLVNTATLEDTEAYEFSVGAQIPLHKVLSIQGTVMYRETVYPGFGFEVTPGIFTIKYAGAFFPKNLGMVNTLGIGFDF